MTKENWIKHIRETSGGIIPPSQGGDRHDWHSALSMHKEQNCKICADRMKTRKANEAQRIRNSILQELCGTSARQAKIDMGL